MRADQIVGAVLLLLCIAAPLVEAAIARWETRRAFAESLRVIESQAGPFVHPMCRCIVEPIDAPACNVIVLNPWKRRRPPDRHRRR